MCLKDTRRDGVATNHEEKDGRISSLKSNGSLTCGTWTYNTTEEESFDDSRRWIARKRRDRDQGGRRR